MADLRHLLAIYVHAHQTGNSVPPHIDAEARATLAAEPPAPGPTIDDIWELCEDHEFHLGMDGANEEESAKGLLEIINTALGRWGRPAPAEPVATLHVSDFRGYENYDFQHLVDLPPGHYKLFTACTAQPPAPAPAADGERDHVPDAGNMVAADDEAQELATLLAIGSSCAAGAKLSPEQCRRAAALLREARPQPVPVPVAERPWERPGWCDAEGLCWWGRCADDFFNPEWTMATLASIEEFCSEAMPQHCLPHWAIAIPQPPQANTTHPTTTEPNGTN